MGSVSLRTYRVSSSGYLASGSYLVYNSSLEAVALLLAVVGAYFFCQSGKSSHPVQVNSVS